MSRSPMTQEPVTPDPPFAPTDQGAFARFLWIHGDSFEDDLRLVWEEGVYQGKAAARAEAQAQVAVLREIAAETRRLGSMVLPAHPAHREAHKALIEKIDRALKDTEPLARDHDARIAREAVEPWRKALSRPPMFQRAKCCSFSVGSHWNAEGVAEGPDVIQPPHEPVIDEDSGLVMVPWAEARDLLATESTQQEDRTPHGHWHGPRFVPGPCTGGAPGDEYPL